MEDVTSVELDMLLDALDALERVPMNEVIMSHMIRAPFCPQSEREHMKEKVEKEVKKVEQEQKAKGDSVVLLKAKLIKLRDRLRKPVEDMIDKAMGEGGRYETEEDSQ